MLFVVEGRENSTEIQAELHTERRNIDRHWRRSVLMFDAFQSVHSLMSSVSLSLHSTAKCDELL